MPNSLSFLVLIKSSSLSETNDIDILKFKGCQLKKYIEDIKKNNNYELEISIL
mgnify:CR=1 FL=1